MRYFLIILAICGIILTGCGGQKPEVQTPQASVKKNITTNQTDTMTKKILQLQVPAYENKGQMPVKFATKTGGGQNLSPEVRWQTLPAAQSYALLFDDKHPIANNWVHWLVVDIPNTTTNIPEGTSRTNMPSGSKELQTSWGRTGYDGPQPPVGSGNHEYVMTLYALDIASLNMPEDATKSEFLKATQPHIIAQESWSGYFSR